MEIKTVTILGANGTMGKNVSAIFASFGKAKVYMVCRDIKKAQKAKEDAYMSVKAETIESSLIPITYEEMGKAISESDLVLELLSEDIDIKRSMYKKIKPFLKEDTILASGTSSISIKELAKEFGNKANNFFGIHFFNPPYHMTLCELISHSKEQEQKENEIESYLKNNLKRTVVKVNDIPGFLGNRIGFFFINEALKLANENKDKGGIDYIDNILGCFTGRNMPPILTADFVGLDVSKAIIDYIYINATNDIFKDYFVLPDFVNELIKDGKLGKKVGKGLFYQDIENGKSYSYDILSKKYLERQKYNFKFAEDMIEAIRIGKYDYAAKILIEDKSKEADICKKMILKYIVYSIYISKENTQNVYSCDDAMSTGFSWLPPIAYIDFLGGKEKVKEMAEKYLEKNWIDVINKYSIFDMIQTESKYDYRSFLKAKK